MKAARETQEVSAGSTLREEETEAPITVPSKSAVPAEIRAFRPVDDAARVHGGQGFLNQVLDVALRHPAARRVSTTSMIPA